MVTITSLSAPTYAPPPSAPLAVQTEPAETPPQSVASAPLAPGAPVADSTVAALVTEQSQDARPADLRGADLRGTDLSGLDLRGADLTGANLAGMDLSGLDLRGARMDGASLEGADLTNARLDGVSAQGANLSGARLINTGLDGADFTQARFDGAFIGKEAPGEGLAISADRMLVAKDLKLEGASFKGAELQSVGLANAKAAGADFSGAVADYLVFGRGSNLSGASFDGLTGRDVRFGGSELTGAAFTNTKVSHADFTASGLDGVRFAGSSLSGKSFNLTDLRQADFSGVVREARYATFNVANLDGLDFGGFDFTGAKIVGSPNSYDGPNRSPAGAIASMNGTSFAGARFDHAMFQEIATEGADFTGAEFTRVLSMGASGVMGREGVSDGWTSGWSRVEAEVQHGLRMAELTGRGSASAPDDGPDAASAQSALQRLSDPVTALQDQAAQLALATLKGINADVRKSQAAARKAQADAAGRGPGGLLQLIA